MERGTPMIRLESTSGAEPISASTSGRATASVFPSAHKPASGQFDKQVVADMLGATTFLSETQLQAMREEAGVAAEPEPDPGPLKPLADVLLEAKVAKDEKYQEIGRTIKQGKNRPLDEDELDFVDGVYQEERRREQEALQQEAAALSSFRAAVKQQQQVKAVDHSKPLLPKKEPLKRKAAPKAARIGLAAVIVAAAPPVAEERRAASGSGEDGADTGGKAAIAGLLGGYGSSDSGSD